MTHTPGPWTLETVKTSVGVCHKIGSFPKRVSVTNGERSYGCVYEDGSSAIVEMERGTLNSELLANARLMAAAPDLLAALKSLLHDIDTGLLVRDITRDGEAGWAMNMLEFVQRLQAAQSAVAKAEGR